jgi:hypothetical protein
MTTEKMNVHKALCELKILDDRIPKAINACKFVALKKVASKQVLSQGVEDFKETEKANLAKAMDLMRRREAIKRAVVLSNAITKVIVAGNEYTVAEAIELKNHGLDWKRKLRESLGYSIRMAEANLEATNAEAERKADAHVQGIANGKDIRAEEIKSIREGYLAGVLVEIVDTVPGGAKEMLKKLDDEINAFMVEVDSALSTSNALTELTIEY